MENEKRNHWEKVYETKQPDEVSWTQEKPVASLNFINSFNLPKTSSIIDIGGGDSRLVDYLLDEEYENITVLDISEKALEKVKLRLGKKAKKVNWIVSDIVQFKPSQRYDVWHDRATFHFLTKEEDVTIYLKIVKASVEKNLAIGTFSENGPDKCSGLEIKKYSKEQLVDEFAEGFKKMECINQDHITPFGTSQNFTFCSFKRLNKS